MAVAADVLWSWGQAQLTEAEPTWPDANGQLKESQSRLEFVTQNNYKKLHCRHLNSDGGSSGCPVALGSGTVDGWRLQWTSCGPRVRPSRPRWSADGPETDQNQRRVSRTSVAPTQNNYRTQFQIPKTHVLRPCETAGPPGFADQLQPRENDDA